MNSWTSGRGGKSTKTRGLSTKNNRLEYSIVVKGTWTHRQQERYIDSEILPIIAFTKSFTTIAFPNQMISHIITTFLLIATCCAQFNLRASTDNTEVANKTICMSSGKAVLLFPPDNSCVFTFKGGILTAYTNNGILFNEGEQLTESDNFRGSQILFKSSVLDPPNDWQFTACPDGDSSWTVWMDASCEGGVKFDAVLTPLDDAALQALEHRDAESTSNTESEQSCDCSPEDSSTSSSPTISTRTVTEVVTVTGDDPSEVTEVTTTRTITQGKVSSTPGVVTVTHHITSFVVGTAQANVPDVAKSAEQPPQAEAPAAAPTAAAEQPPAGAEEPPAWNVGAPTGGEGGVGVEANPTPDSGNGGGGEGAPKPTIWWTQPSSPWWTQQTAPWWTPESIATRVASSGVSGKASASSSAQENGSPRAWAPNNHLKTALETLLALFTVHITFF